MAFTVICGVSCGRCLVAVFSLLAEGYSLADIDNLPDPDLLPMYIIIESALGSSGSIVKQLK